VNQKYGREVERARRKILLLLFWLRAEKKHPERDVGGDIIIRIERRTYNSLG
jgi:hypothetical protein